MYRMVSRSGNTLAHVSKRKISRLEQALLDTDVVTPETIMHVGRNADISEVFSPPRVTEMAKEFGLRSI